MRLWKWVTVLVAAVGLPARADVVVAYTATAIGALSGASGSTSVTAINAVGQITGSSPVLNGDQHAFLYSNGVMTDLGTLGGSASVANGINASGQVVGTSATAAGDQHAFLYSNSVMTDLGTLGGTGSVAYGINAAGTVVGTLMTASGNPQGFSYANGTMTPITYVSSFIYGTRVTAPAVNTSGDILVNSVEYDGVSDEYSVFRLHHNNFIPLAPNLTYTCTTLVTGVPAAVASVFQGLALNDAGLAVGIYVACPVYSGADTAWSSDQVVELTLPAGQDPSKALGINNSNTVVGEYTTASGLHAFATTPLVGPLDLNSAVAPGVLAAGEVLTSASAVNDSGVIVAVSNLGHAYSLMPSRSVASFTPASLWFGSQRVGTTGSPQAATYTNSSTASVSIDSVSVPANFSQTNNCGSTLAAGTSCTIQISFAPQAPGVFFSMATVTASGLPFHVATFTATGTFSATLSSSAAMTTVGHPVMLSWASFALASCTSAGGTSSDSWAGRHLSGSGSLSVTEQAAGAYTYSVQCAYGGVTTAVARVTVNVSAQPTITPPPTMPPSTGGGGAMGLYALLALGAALSMRAGRWRTAARRP
jgi:probable HAF family extracellular repeat protein